MARRARIDGEADVRPPSERAGARPRLRAATGLSALAVAFGAVTLGGVVLAPVGLRAANADAIDEARSAFVDATPASWPARLAELAKEPGRLGAVVGPLLRDRDPRRTKAGAFCAAWLCDHPDARGRAPLEDDILRRAARDPSFVADLRASLSVDGAGWARLLGTARELLGATGADTTLVASAVWMLRFETTASNALELLDVWEQAGDPSVRTAAAESLASLLGTRFDKPIEARQFFDANRGRTLFDWVRDLSAAKDRPDSVMFLRLLAEVRRNLERATTPAEIRPYLVTDAAPWPEVRLLAARRAAQLEGDAAAWVPLFIEAVSNEADAETLTTLLDAFDRLGVAANAPGSELAARTADRLEERPAPVDSLAVRLLVILGRLGTPSQLHRAFATLSERRASAPVFAAWLDAAASLGRCGTDVREFHRRRRSATGAEDVALRVRALEALARGVVASPDEGPRGDASSAEAAEEARQSGAYLVEVLAGAADGGGPRDAGPAIPAVIEERFAAARGLEVFPGPGAVAALEARAIDPAEDAGLARLCASVLGRLAAKGDGREAAIDALVRVAGAPGTPAARVSAVDDLSRLSREETSDDRRRSLVGGLRGALGAAAPLEVRRAAARAAALAGDAEALAGVFALVVVDIETAGADGTVATGPDSGQWSADRLVRAVVARDAESDAALALESRDLVDRGPAAAAIAVSLAESAADAGGGRPVLQELRAMLLQRRSNAVGRTLDESVDDLEAARRVLTSALRGASAADRLEPVWLRMAAIDDNVVTTLLRLRVRQMASIPDDAASDPRRLDARRGLEAALRSALDAHSTSRAVEAALASDRVALERLRSSPFDTIRRAALVDSARAETRADADAAAAARARAHLSEAKRLGPTPDEVAEIARIEAELDGTGAPPAPR